MKENKEQSEDLNRLRDQVIEGGLRLMSEGLVERTWGNISVRVNEENMLITPSGRSYEELTRDDIVLVNYHSGKYEGPAQPSSEKKLHSEIYRARNDVNAVVHTHQMNASTVAAARREVPPILDDMTQIIGPTVRCTEYALSGTRKLVRKTVKALRGRNAALMANHGAVCVGRDMDEAFVVCQVLEKACRAFIEAEFLGGARTIGKFKAHLMHRSYLRKYSARATRNKNSAGEPKDQ
jgi:L-fuculose-phosphate aldolase